MLFADAHIHITDLKRWQPFTYGADMSPVCSCAHSKTEWNELLRVSRLYPDFVVCAAGIHPQNPDEKLIDFLTEALEKGEAAAIGEAGFDFFTPEYKARETEQELVWEVQLELAQRFQKPLVIHCRRALDRLFRDSKKLSRLCSVIFHSFPGSPMEALSFIKRGVNARFSFGKPLLNGNKRALLCAAQLPLDMLLGETDAPWQRLKNESATLPSDIQKVYEKIAELRGLPIENLCAHLYANFKDSFGLH
ncbi:MAG: TatD family hydrolase [Treponema lecithinolyticum]